MPKSGILRANHDLLPANYSSLLLAVLPRARGFAAEDRLVVGRRGGDDVRDPGTRVEPRHLSGTT